MKYFNFLQSGNQIQVVAPSCGLRDNDKLLYKSAVKRFTKLGYNVFSTKSLLNTDGCVSNTPINRASEFTNAWLNPNVHALIAVSGGEFMLEILPHLNPTQLLGVSPKIFQGFSDNTTLTHYLATVLDTASIYHYNFCTLGTKKLHPSIYDSIQLLTGKKLSFSGYKTYQSQKPTTPKKLLKKFVLNNTTSYTIIPQQNNVNLTGRMLGGCLDILVCFAGTQFDKVLQFNNTYASDGILWYLEISDINPAEVRRAIWQLKNAGWFSTAKGFIIGRPLNNKSYKNISFESAILYHLSDLNVPIILNLDIGHVYPTIPIINGALANVTCQPIHLNISYQLV